MSRRAGFLVAAVAFFFLGTAASASSPGGRPRRARRQAGTDARRQELAHLEQAVAIVGTAVDRRSA